MFRLAHLTDPHVGPLPRPRLRQLMSKRATGWVNWSRGRRLTHDMEILAALVSDIQAAAPDHIACTGDLCNIGLPSEWETARLFLGGLGAPEAVSFVPGNHDAYVRGSLEGLLEAVGPWTRDDAGRDKAFPYLRRRGALALIGLSSAIPTAPFVASGRLGTAQLQAAERLLAALATEADRPCRVVMIHHPPHVGGAQPGRNLTDAGAFEAMIARVGADLVLHGHNHVGSIAFLTAPGGRRVPVIGAPSASARGGLLKHCAGYHLYTIERQGTGFALTASLRGLLPEGGMGDLGTLTLRT
ncbi:3',5'-cyclic adenosine monophosphate phosphodiesterase CpdA [Methylobacterium crusticola]|uniref:3',5'-cyclic adenosine monophosphate phosphodiesterase CpdA n=1 Tax=Methylobacterium crusticola TaxID=1697972 RepID=A0ABQ4QT90_9HYPH|nr:metallophosphoesterase [Methylobacterium crusticola]GJD47901.1 3',5'-cyclic adenosine monophosphate phosphodiesterase CpdA [Methylobacterium crusticola]